VVQARKAGIYVSVMLFEGYTPDKGPLPDAYQGHPFAAENNINGIDGDVDDDGRLREPYTLPAQGGVGRIKASQKAYVRKVIDSVGDLDNVLFEVANEALPLSTAWQYDMIRFVKAYEKHRPKQHPVGMTFQHSGGSNDTLYKSPADWISPIGDPFRPEASPGAKVVLSDTDHLCGICTADDDWAWREFASGRNPIYMDAYDDPHWRSFAGSAERARVGMGDTRRYAERIRLAPMKPQPALSSTRYVLADRGSQYLVYKPGGGSFTLDLTRNAGQTLDVEWFSLAARSKTITTIAGGERTELQVPFKGAAAAYLRAHTDYRSSGTILVTHDAGRPTRWSSLSVKAVNASRTSISTAFRSSDDTRSWSRWQRAVDLVPANRYLEIRLTLATRNGNRTPVIDKLVLR
jgi:hypothetical protein